MRWLAHVAVRANPKRNGVMIRSRRQNFASLPQALSSDSENTHWNLSATMLSCPWSIWDSFRGIQSHTHNWSFGWITIKIHNKIKYLKVPTYELQSHIFEINTTIALEPFAQGRDRPGGFLRTQVTLCPQAASHLVDQSFECDVTRPDVLHQAETHGVRTQTGPERATVVPSRRRYRLEQIFARRIFFIRATL